ncbi:MAG: NnrS family protein, partial [Hyphomonadaceae bacterium]
MMREAQPIPFLERGFRPFFLGASLFAGIAIPVWALMLSQGWAPPGYLQAQQWHVHEMIFGFVPAVIAGFLLTAIPNWTGRPPVAGGLLLALFAIWIAGRLAMAFLGSAPLVSAGIAAAFPICLTRIIA